MRRTSLVLMTVIACLLGSAGVAGARRPSAPNPVTAARNRPAPVTRLHTYTVRNGATVHWRNPAVRSFAHAVVRYARGASAPTRPSHGHAVRLVRGRTNAARLTGLRPNTRYSVAVWALDTSGRYSAARTAGFVSAVPRATPGTYTARIVDDAGNPLLNANVTAEAYTGSSGGHVTHARSALDGDVSLSLTPGGWFITIGGQHISGGNSDPTGYEAFGDDVVVRSGVTTSRGDITLDPGGALTGRVTDRSGNPLDNVHLTVAPVAPYVQSGQNSAFFVFLGSDPNASVTTGSDGSYTIKGVDGAQALRVCASTGADPVTGGAADAVGYTNRCASRSVLVPASRVVTASTIALDGELGGRLIGRITEPGGTPASDAIVEFSGATGVGLAGFAEAGADGSYEMSDLSPGAYRVCALEIVQPRSSRTGYSARCRTGRVVVVTGGASRANVRLGLGAAVSGRVAGVGAVPLGGVLVDVGGRNGHGEAVTDAAGHYRVRGLGSGVYRGCVVDTSSIGSRALPTGVQPGCFGMRTHFGARAGAVRNGIDIRLRVGGAITGTLLDSSGAPVASAEVDAAGVGSTNVGSAQTDAAGHFAIHGLAARRYRVCFTTFSDDLSSILTRCHVGRVAVRIGRITRRVDGVLPIRAQIAVTVHDSGGRPVAGVDAAALAPCSDQCDTPRLFGGHLDTEIDASAVTDSQGVATLQGLAPGSYAVCLFAYYATTAAGGAPDGYADGCSGSTFDISVRNGAVTAISLTLADGGAVTGRVVDAAGRPISGVLVHVSHSAADDYQDAAGADDFFFGLDESAGPEDESVTASDGTYTVRGVRPGTSAVCGDASNATGPARGGYSDRCLGGPDGATSGGTRVDVQADTTTAVPDLVLDPAPAISGRVLAARGGAPIAHAVVILFLGRRLKLGTEAQTAADGSYTASRLRPGRYTVCAIAGRTDGQCYRGVPWDYRRTFPPLAAATLVPVTSGVTTHIGFRLAAHRGH